MLQERCRTYNGKFALILISWKAQVRLCGRYRRLDGAGKKLPVIIAAIAREMAAFLWAIGRQITPAAVI